MMCWTKVFHYIMQYRWPRSVALLSRVVEKGAHSRKRVTDMVPREFGDKDVGMGFNLTNNESVLV